MTSGVQKGLEPSEALRQAQQWVWDTTNGEKRDHFGSFLPEFGGSGMPYAAANSLYQAVVLLFSENRDYAHPYYWAAFGHVGM